MDLLTTVATAAKAYGGLAATIVFFLWRDWQREGRLSTRIDQLEDEQRKTILPLVKECSAVIGRNTLIMERLEKLLEHKR